MTVAADASAAKPAVPRQWLVFLALGIVYVVWGSTYLGIRIVVEDMSPLASASWRFMAGGLILGVAIASFKGWRTLHVHRRELLGCAAIGLMLPALGNGLVVVAEHRGAPSGVAALLVAAVPLWVIVYRVIAGDRPTGRTIAGVLFGFAGLVGLIAASGIGGDVNVGACLIVVVATLFWSFGSWAMPRLPLPKNPFVMAVYEMLFGALALFVMAAASGEHLLPQKAPADAWIAWVYLVIFGSVIAFTSYVWVLSVAPISLVATYAYVNPVVAVFLGWAILSEPITLAIVIGGGVVVASVALVISAERRPRAVAPPPSKIGEPTTTAAA